jgi:hypothetical protein
LTAPIENQVEAIAVASTAVPNFAGSMCAALTASVPTIEADYFNLGNLVESNTGAGSKHRLAAEM